MASYNRIIMMGNLTRDPEHKQLASGQSVCRLGLASNRQFKNKQNGQTVQEVCFIDVDVWGAQAESCGQYLKKGRSVLIEGRLKLDSWQDTDGKNRSKHSIVADRVTFLFSGADGSEESGFTNLEPQQKSQGLDFEPFESPKHVAKKATKKSTKSMDTTFGDDSEISFGEVNLDSQKPFEDDLPF